jgi:tRNA threonylcarbamoyladenosine biosynthesis protein TsaB
MPHHMLCCKDPLNQSFPIHDYETTELRKSRILALDTSTQACTVALQTEEGIREIFRVIPRRHNQELLPMIEEVLDAGSSSLTSLDCIAFGCGPGSFTGLRITVGVVQGLAFGTNLPVVPVSTLACLAQGWFRTTGEQRCLVAMQAREEEIYWGSYTLQDGLMTRVGDERVMQASEVRLPEPGAWFGVGDGWVHRTILEEALGQNTLAIDLKALPHARDLIALAENDYRQGRYVDAEHARPVYLRETVAKKSS